MTLPVALFLFDDAEARRWTPFALTRPIGELLFGCMTLRERAERAFGTPCRGHICGPELTGFDEPGAPPVVERASVGTQGIRILLTSRAVPTLGRNVITLDAGAATEIVLDGERVGWVLPDGVPVPEEDALRSPRSLGTPPRRMALDGIVLERPWHLVAENAGQVARDVSLLWGDDTGPAGVHRVGRGILSLADGASIEPGVTVDTRHGPVRLAEGASVEGPARITGPLFLGPGTVVFGGSVGASSDGPACKVRGEISDSVFLGYVNKAHDGFVGHALLGRWVNLGAMTTTSDLKNDYGVVRVWAPEGEVSTGMIKVGCFLGDHVKTGIGTVLNTGTVVGAGSNLFGGTMPPKLVPPFSWGSGSNLSTYRLDRFLEVVERAMARRGQELTPGVRRILERSWSETATLRGA